MEWTIPLSTSQMNTVASIGSLEGIFIASSVLIASTTAETILASGSGNRVIVEGTVAGFDVGSRAISLGNQAAVDSGNSIEIAVGGEVQAFNFGTAIGVSAFGSHIVNNGLVSAKDSIGILLQGVSDTTRTTITNNGRIEAEMAIGHNGGDPASETIVLRNTGTIDGEVASYGVFFDIFCQSKDLITNSGLMIGDVLLNDNDDLYDGRKGSIRGDVFGGNGDDRIYGGKERNVLDGGEDDDSIRGGGGRDQLSGGSGKDQFIFTTIGDSSVKATGRDVITDFSKIEADRIDLHAIDADTTEKGNQDSDFIAKDAFGKTAGELRFEKADGLLTLYGDVNGDGKADFAIDFDNTLKLSVGDFIS
ncbi:MAG: hypothetical protein JWM58_633 [Rhizobium sp.]|nr:hypothetical protein [Rhizobium sp.]